MRVNVPQDIQNIKKHKEDRMAKKVAVKKTEVKKEVVDTTPKGYYVDFYFKREPIEKDKIIGTIFYSDTTEKIDIEWLEPTWSSDIEQLMMGDIMFMDGLKQVFVSRYEDRKNWMLNLHKYDFKTAFYACEARIINETE